MNTLLLSRNTIQANYNDKVERVIALLSLFSTLQLEEIVDVIQNHGRQVIPSPNDRKEQNLPPALFAFLTNQDYKYPATNVKELLWGFSTMVYASFRKGGKDENYYVSILVDAFGITTEYAKIIAKKIETPDAIAGFGANALDKLRRLINYPLPDSFEIPQNDKFDTDSGYEMMLLGRELIALALREQMKVGSLAHYINAGLIFSFNKEGGDPTDDVANADRLLKLIDHAASPSGDIEEGGPMGLLLRLSRAAIKRLPPAALTKAVTKAVAIKQGRNRKLKTAPASFADVHKKSGNDDLSDDQGYDDAEDDDE